MGCGSSTGKVLTAGKNSEAGRGPSSAVCQSGSLRHCGRASTAAEAAPGVPHKPPTSGSSTLAASLSSAVGPSSAAAAAGGCERLCEHQQSGRRPLSPCALAPNPLAPELRAPEGRGALRPLQRGSLLSSRASICGAQGSFATTELLPTASIHHRLELRGGQAACPESVATTSSSKASGAFSGSSIAVGSSLALIAGSSSIELSSTPVVTSAQATRCTSSRSGALTDLSCCSDAAAARHRSGSLALANAAPGIGAAELDANAMPPSASGWSLDDSERLHQLRDGTASSEFTTRTAAASDSAVVEGGSDPHAAASITGSKKNKKKNPGPKSATSLERWPDVLPAEPSTDVANGGRREWESIASSGPSSRAERPKNTAPAEEGAGANPHAQQRAEDVPAVAFFSVNEGAAEDLRQLCSRLTNSTQTSSEERVTGANVNTEALEQ